MQFKDIVPYLSDPLVLTGFALFVFFGLAKTIVNSGILSPIGGRGRERILLRALTYGFILSVIVIPLSIGLKYRDLSTAEQKRVVAQVEDEVRANLETMNTLVRNLETILRNTNTVGEVLRHPEIRILNAMFPWSNIDLSTTNDPSMVAARGILEDLIASGDLENELERDRLDQASVVISETIGRTISTIEAMSDAEGKRYTISDGNWRANLAVVRKVVLVDLTYLQSFHTRLARTRAEYNLVTERAIEYLSNVQQFLDADNGAITIPRLANVLASERQFYEIAHSFGLQIVKDIEKLKLARKHLNDAGNH